MQRVLTLPLPPPALHAHAKGGWHGKSGPTKKYRMDAYLLASGRKYVTRFERARLSIAFFWPNFIRRDTLNAVHSIKPAIDGIVDAGWIMDDDWQHMEIGSINSAVDRENPRVELTIEELT